MLSTLKLLLSKNVTYLRYLATIRSNSNANCIKTASIIIIGNEILKGMVVDTNSHFICKLLYKMGVSMQKIVVVGDDVEIIANEIKAHSCKYDYVLTSGGIGPTHDDVTFEAVAKAFDETLVLNPILEEICKQFASHKAQMKMANIPKSAKLVFGIDEKTGKMLRYPSISVHNIYVFPGIPQLMEKSLLSICKTLFASNNTFYLKTIHINASEFEIIPQLNNVVQEYSTITFGSYPEIKNNKFIVKITMESTDKEVLERAYDKFSKLLPKEVVVDKSNGD